MKTACSLISPSRGQYTTPIALLIAISGFLLSSCENLREIAEVSTDAARQRTTGPSYPEPSYDAMEMSLNMMLGLYMPITSHSGGNNFGFNVTNAAPSLVAKSDLRAGEALYASLAPMSFYEQRQPFAGPTARSAPKKQASFLDNIYVMAGPELVLKNSKDGGTKIRTGYLQLPVYGLYRYAIPGGGAVFGGLGPYFAYGLWGKFKSSYGSEDAFSSTAWRRFDAGLGFTAGYQLPAGYYARLGYEIGMVNIDHDKYDHTKMRSFFLAIGVPLSKLGVGN